MSLWNWCSADPACLGLHGWSDWIWSKRRSANVRVCQWCGYVQVRR